MFKYNIIDDKIIEYVDGDIKFEITYKDTSDTLTIENELRRINNLYYNDVDIEDFDYSEHSISLSGATITEDKKYFIFEIEGDIVNEVYKCTTKTNKEYKHVIDLLKLHIDEKINETE